MAPPQYGSISSDHDETTPLEVGDGSAGSSSSNKADKEKSRRAFALCAAASLVVLSALFVSGQHYWYYSRPDPPTTKLSFLSPEDDMGYLAIDRVHDAGPSSIWGNKLGKQPLPTNSWYLNLLSHRAAYQPDESTRVYTYPYIIDTAPSMTAGIRIHWPVMQASDRNMQMVYDASNGLTLGTLDEMTQGYTVDDDQDLSLLGVSLQWKNNKNGTMKSNIVRGMPYATMRYSGGILPTLTSANQPAADPIVDGSQSIACGLLKEDGTVSGATLYSVQREILLQFKDSDFTWVVFFSRPVKIQCAATPKVDVSVPGSIASVALQLNVLETTSENEELVVRVALVNQCTTGKSDLQGHCSNTTKFEDPKGYLESLRSHAHLFPQSPKVDFEYDSNDCNVEFDWDAQSTNQQSSRRRLAANKEDDKTELLMFALPHHQSMLDDSSAVVSKHCISTFHGPTCLVEGNKWLLKEDLGSPQSFLANRPPQASAIPALATAVSTDLKYQLSSNLLRGAADTYFSGKILAKMGRVIVLASELKDLASGSTVYSDVDPQEFTLAVKAAAKETLPTDEDIESAVDMLKRGVQIWLNGNGEAPFVYDRSWGGLVNCGCTYHGEGDKGVCNNTFPHCPALADVNIDFGNGKTSLR